MKKNQRRYNDIPTATSLDEAKALYDENPTATVLCTEGDRSQECTSVEQAETFFAGE